MEQTRRLYADHNATCPSTLDHWEEVLAITKDADGNASSTHKEGRKARSVLEEARKRVAALVHAPVSSILFTAGATESNNIVVHGIMEQALKSKPNPSLVLSEGEHPSVCAPCDWMQERHCSVNRVPLTKDGLVDETKLLENITDATALVCLIHVHNEVGSINPVEELASKIKQKNPLVHVHIDGVQSLGKVPLDLHKDSPIDTMAFSAHKIGGFKGIGALYKNPRVKDLCPLYRGGSQEFGWRPGTQNIAGAVSFGLRAKDLVENPDWLKVALEEGSILREGLKHLPKVGLHSTWSCVSTVNHFHVLNKESDLLMLALDQKGVAVSTGSACSSGVVKPSKTLLSMGYTPWEATNSIRASFGPCTVKGDGALFLEILESLI